MLKVKKKIEKDGRIEIGDILKDAKIKPGDWVEVSPYKNKIIIEISKHKQSKEVVNKAAGILKEEPELIEEMLKAREEEDDRPNLKQNPPYCRPFLLRGFIVLFAWGNNKLKKLLKTPPNIKKNLQY